MSNTMIDEHEEATPEELAEEQALQDLVNGVEPKADDKPDNTNDSVDDNDNTIIDDKDFDENDDNIDNENLDDNSDNNDDNIDDNEDVENKDLDDNTNDDNGDFETLSVNVNGTDIEVNSVEELRAVVSKLTEEKPFEINNEKELLDQSGLTEDDIALFADIKNGSKAALNELLKRQEVTLDDLDDARNEEYKQGFKFQEVTETQVLAKQIMADEAFLGKYNEQVSQLPKDFAEAVHGDAQAMKHFMKHVKTGVAEKIIPLAKKESLLNGTDFMTAYAKIGRELSGAKPDTKPEAKKQTREVKEESRSRRAKRSQTRSNTPKEPTAQEIAEMSDEDFVAKYGE